MADRDDVLVRMVFYKETQRFYVFRQLFAPGERSLIGDLYLPKEVVEAMDGPPYIDVMISPAEGAE